MNNIDLLKQGMETAFISSETSSNLAFKTQFISNNHKEGRKVIASIEDELLKCEEFSISVAFITMSGITPLLQTLKELEKRGIPGKVLTTDYLNFSEPAALKILQKLKNIDLKMYMTYHASEGFHTKGYIFRKEEIYRIIVGSSNLTQSALTTNREWNTRIVSSENGEYASDIIREFNELWSSRLSLRFDDFIERYEEEYTENKIIERQKEIALQEKIISLDQYKLQPNYMQTGFIKNLMKLNEAGKDRALLISATGENGILG